MWSRKKFLLTVGGGIILLVIVIYLIVWALTPKSNPAETQNNSDVAAQDGTTQTPEAPKQPVKTLTPEEEQQLYAKQVAAIVATRFGTYSNHAGGKNIESLLPFLTENAKKTFASYIKPAEEKDAYTGVTTRVASTEIKEWLADKKAVIIAHAFKDEEQNGVSKTSLVDARVTLLKVGGVWLVDSLTWQ